jgi:hypothetical protein
MGMGFSEGVTPEDASKQDRRRAEMQRQEEEAKRKQTASGRVS